MRIAVLASPDSWYLNDLRRAAGPEHRIVPAKFGEMCAAVSDGTAMSCDAGDADLAAADAVLVRTMPPGSLEQVVLRMDMLNRLRIGGTVVVNPARALEASVDKYLATCKLSAAGLPVPRTVVCQTAERAMTAFHQLGRDVVIKPLFGGEGRGITRVSDEELAERAFKLLQQMQSVIYLQQFVPHRGADFRLLVIGEEILAVERRNSADWRTNVSRGARALPLRADPELRETARRAARAVGASVAGVDVLPAADGGRYVLEVNAVPGWRAVARTLEIDVAGRILDHVASLVGRSLPADEALE